jgi:hypothetical protein
MDNEDTSRRADLEAAFDKVEQAQATPEPAQEVIAVPDAPIGDKATDDAASQKARDEKGRFAPKIGDKAPEPPKEVAPVKVEAKPAAPSAPPPITEVAQPKIAPPRSLKATTREGWAKLPREMQEDIAVWDRETLKTKSEAAQAMQMASSFKEAISPYEHLFRAEGVEPMQGIGNLMRTTAALATGAPQTKASIVAGIIKTYGVDIATLDALLSGQAAPQAQPSYDPGMVARQAQEAVRQELAQYQQRAAQTTAASQLEAFEATEPEFFDDLRDDMARLLESGFAKDYNDAYSKAQLLNPTVARVVEQRKAAASANGVQRAQAAASSVRGQPAIGVAASPERDRRGDLEDAWNKIHGGNR